MNEEEFGDQKDEQFEDEDEKRQDWEEVQRIMRLRLKLRRVCEDDDG